MGTKKPPTAGRQSLLRLLLCVAPVLIIPQSLGALSPALPERTIHPAHQVAIRTTLAEYLFAFEEILVGVGFRVRQRAYAPTMPIERALIKSILLEEDDENPPRCPDCSTYTFDCVLPNELRGRFTLGFDVDASTLIFEHAYFEDPAFQTPFVETTDSLVEQIVSEIERQLQ